MRTDIYKLGSGVIDSITDLCLCSLFYELFIILGDDGKKSLWLLSVFFFNLSPIFSHKSFLLLFESLFSVALATFSLCGSPRWHSQLPNDLGLMQMSSPACVCFVSNGANRSEHALDINTQLLRGSTDFSKFQSSLYLLDFYITLIIIFIYPH